MDNANIFCQSDGGQKGQEVRLFTLLDKADKTQFKHGVICEFWADLTYTGKTSDEVAAGTNHSLQKIGHPNKRIKGSTSNSGAGTPEPMPVPKLASGTNKACWICAVSMTCNLCFDWQCSSLRVREG
jgi:hypothetical protein